MSDRPADGPTYVDQARVVAVFEVVKHRGLVQTRELGHVFHLAEFGWIHLLNVVLVDQGLLAVLGQLHHHFIAALLSYAGSFEAVAFRWNPDQPLGGPVSLCGWVVDQSTVYKQVALWVLLPAPLRHGCWGVQDATADLKVEERTQVKATEAGPSAVNMLKTTAESSPSSHFMCLSHGHHLQRMRGAAGLRGTTLGRSRTS